MSWTAYAPEGVTPPPCSFCGDAERQVTVAPDLRAAICDQCAARIADIMGRGGKPPPAQRPIDPRDARHPIMVALDDRPFGDLGHPRTDARVLLAIVLRDREVAAWLRERGIDEAAIRRDLGARDLGF